MQTHKPPDHCNSLFAVTGASNITNSKADLSIVEYASSMGFHTLLDAAALAPTSKICLADTSVDAMAVSFYKMFGYPTGVGALVVKKSFLAKLKRPWFAGGTVDVVQVPGTIVTAASETYEQFEVIPSLLHVHSDAHTNLVRMGRLIIQASMPSHKASECYPITSHCSHSGCHASCTTSLTHYPN